MDIRKIFAQSRPVFSFEFFLPKAPEDLSAFIASLDAFKTLNPDFITLTYGAGGSSGERTIEAAGRIKKETGLETVCHLTGLLHSKQEIEEKLSRLKAQGINHIVALRGDIPQGMKMAPGSRDFPHAKDLIEWIREKNGFQIAAAGYPETHPEAISPQDDIERLAEKARAGADWIITQLFFDNRHYFDFTKRARAAGVACSLIPGLMPVANFSQLKRFSSLCGASIPKKMERELEKIQGDPEAVIRYGIDWTTRQARELLAAGAPGIHFYTLNRSRSTSEVLKRLRA